jgi:hypothetical protein
MYVSKEGMVMGMITSDFYSRFGKIDIVESPFTAEELMNLASVDTQAQFAAWTAENGDTSYIPAEIFLTLLEDRTFFEQISSFVDGGEYVVLSGATLACRTSHSSRMGLTREDVQQNIQEFFLKDEEMTYSIESVLSGTREWVSSLYVFANGWVGIETERFADSGWDEDEDAAQDVRLRGKGNGGHLVTDSVASSDGLVTAITSNGATSASRSCRMAILDAH